MELQWGKRIISICTLFTLTAAVTVIDLTPSDCSGWFILPYNHSVTYVRVRPEYTPFGNDCNVTFYTEDRSGNVKFEFSDDDGLQSFIDAKMVFIYLFANKNSSISTLVGNYSSANTEALKHSNSQHLKTNSITLSINGGYSNQWALYFSVWAIDGPVSGYPFSVACGVVALCLGSLTVLTLFVVCCCCCCCNKGASRSRRRARIIESLRKEGYSVSRNYGATSDTTPILTNDGIIDVFSGPTFDQPTRLPPPPGVSRYEPPPSYSSVASHRHVVNNQQSAIGQSSCNHLVGQAPITGQPSVHLPSAPEPDLTSRGNQHMPSGDSLQAGSHYQEVPEAILVEIDVNHRASQEDLMQFGTPPTAPELPNVDLLGNEIHNPPPPVYGEAY